MEPANLLSPFVLAYLLIVVGAQLGLAERQRRDRNQREAKRRKAGLDERTILNTGTRLETVRREARVEAGVLLATVVVTPFLLVLIADALDSEAAREGLGVVFAALLIWMLFTASDVGKAFLGGLAFRTLIAFKRPFQVGDRVTLKGHAGKVTEIGPFHVRLTTPDDDLVAIPTGSLWGETLVSANAGDRASLCVMPFYLAPFATREQRKTAENGLWDAIQASTFFDFTKPMQIYVEQTDNAIKLIAKAYAANTYDEPLFKSDVASAFLDWAADKRIPLASTRWREARKEDNPPAEPEAAEEETSP